MRRPCLDCDTLTTRPVRGRCPACHHARYGGLSHSAAHAKARAALAPLLPAPCTRCGQDVAPTDEWDADLRPQGWAPAHASCNRSAGALGIA
mgnify:FL=1